MLAVTGAPTPEWCDEVKKNLPSICTVTNTDCTGLSCTENFKIGHLTLAANVNLCANPISLTVEGEIGKESISHTFDVGHDSFKISEFPPISLEVDLQTSTGAEADLSIDLSIDVVGYHVTLWKAEGANPATCPSHNIFGSIYVKIGAGVAGFLMIALFAYCCAYCCGCCSKSKDKRDNIEIQYVQIPSYQHQPMLEHDQQSYAGMQQQFHFQQQPGAQ